MSRLQRLRYMALAVMLLGVLSIAARSEARSLTDALVKGYERTAPFYSIGTQNNQPLCPCALAGALADALSTATSQAITQDVPIASVAPAFSYHFNPDLNVWDKSTGMLGPLFAERALTIGKGKFNFNIGYAYVEFDDINGTNLNNLNTGPGMLLTSDKYNNAAAQLHTRLDVQTQVFAPTFRYGITDRLDVSLVVPILNTYLRIDNTTVLLADQTTQNPGDLSNPENLKKLSFVKTDSRPIGESRSAESATGVGDLLLRAKYNFWREESGGAAFGLSLFLPSGKEDNLQGTGDTYVVPSLILSQILWDRFEPHLNLGFNLNANDVDLSSFLYTVGATVQVLPPLALMIDVLGRTEFNGLPIKQSELNAAGLSLNKPINQCTSDAPCSGQQTENGVPIFPENLAQQNDVVNFAFGLRYALGESGSIYFGGVVPLNDDGFRSDFIPSGGVEYTF